MLWDKIFTLRIKRSSIISDLEILFQLHVLPITHL